MIPINSWGFPIEESRWTEGPDALTRSVHTPLNELESLWQENLRSATQPALEVDWERISDQGCG